MTSFSLERVTFILLDFDEIRLDKHEKSLCPFPFADLVSSQSLDKIFEKPLVASENDVMDVKEKDQVNQKQNLPTSRLSEKHKRPNLSPSPSSKQLKKVKMTKDVIFSFSCKCNFEAYCSFKTFGKAIVHLKAICPDVFEACHENYNKVIKVSGDTESYLHKCRLCPFLTDNPCGILRHLRHYHSTITETWNISDHFDCGKGRIKSSKWSAKEVKDLVDGIRKHGKCWSRFGKMKNSDSKLRVSGRQKC